MATALPARANLDYLKKLCKERVKKLRAQGKAARLAAAQRDLAREFGFASWAGLRAEAVKRSRAQAGGTAATEAADAFLRAVAEGELERVRKMAAQTPALVNTPGKHPTWGGMPQALHVAVERDQSAVLTFLLASGADASGDNAGYDGWSPLMLAVHWNRPDMQKALLQAGARKGLIELLMLRNDAGLEKLLAKSPDVTADKMPNGGTALHFATTTRAVELLLAAGVDPAVKNKYGKTALESVAALGPAAQDAVDALRAVGGPMSAVMLAAVGDLAGLQAAAARDPAVLLRESAGAIARETPLHAAAGKGHPEVVRWLLAQGVPVNLPAGAGVTPLHAAAWAGQLACATTLVEAGADITARDQEHGTTPAIWARTSAKMFGRAGCQEVADYLERLGNSDAPNPTAPPAPAASATGGASKEDILNILLELAVDATDLRDRGAAAARKMLAERPALATGNIYTAAATGSVEGLRACLAKDRQLANKPGGVRDWVPLLYLCYSLLLKEEKSKKRRTDFAACAQLLLQAGADANAWFVNTGDQQKESALYGASGRARDAALTKLLLEAGANVDDGESLYHACESTDHACLKLLLARKPANISFCLCHKMDFEDVAGVKLFLKYGADPNQMITKAANDLIGLRPLHFAIYRGRSEQMLQALLVGGADANLPNAAGLTPYAFARQLGRPGAAACLARSDAETRLTERETFFAACSLGHQKEARRMAAAHPEFVTTLSEREAALLPEAAAAGNLKAVRLMLNLGFTLEARGGWGATALHQAAWNGHVAVVKFLLERGARNDLLQHFGGDALQTAIHGARHGGHTQGAAIVALIAARMKSADWAKLLEKAHAEGAGPEIVAVLEELVRSSSDDPAVRALPEHRRTHKIAAWKPLMDAAFAGDAARVKKLLSEGHDPNVVSTTPAQYRPLHRAVEFKKTEPRGPGHEAVVRALLAGGADPHQRGGWLRLTALGLAATGEVRFVDLLRPHFEPLDLFHAAALGEEARVAALLKNDPTLARAKDASGWTALHYVSHSALFGVSAELKRALLAIARRLLAAEADVGAAYLFEDEWPIPVLYGSAGWHDFPEMTELLLRAGATACDRESVYHAADEGHAQSLAVIERLTDKKALAEECSISLSIMLHWGRTRGLKWLLEHGGDANRLSEKWGNSALHEAAQRGSAEKVIALLLNFGADPKRKNRAGKTALELAKTAGHDRVWRQLRAEPGR